MEYYAEEPWGESRADMRMAAQTLFLAGIFSEDAELPELAHPYFAHLSEEALEDRAAIIDDFVKRKYGSLNRKTGNPADGGHVRPDDGADARTGLD